VIGIARERQAGQAVVARGGEQPQRVPARPPGRRRRRAGLEDREARALLGEVVADRQAGLPAADHDDVVGRHARRASKRRRRSALPTTERLENTIARLATTGLSRPIAASGMAATL
jgi:hypothetical protein